MLYFYHNMFLSSTAARLNSTLISFCLLYNHLMRLQENQHTAISSEPKFYNLKILFQTLSATNAAWPKTVYSHSLWLSFQTCKMGIEYYLSHKFIVRIKWLHILKSLELCLPLLYMLVPELL